MDYNNQDIERAINYLHKNYPDARFNNNKNICSSGTQPEDITREFKYITMKQSVFKNVNFKNSIFENVALTGSSFENVTFNKTELIGNSFANCDFYNTEIEGENKIFEANNFSQSNFEICNFNYVNLFRSGLLNTLFHNCEFKAAYFHGSTFEGTKFVNCTLEDCDFGRVNLDYTIFTKNVYHNIRLPFYQIAFIIGSADFINDSSQEVYASIGEKNITMNEFYSQIDNLILFYLDKNEYFPVCNLLIAKEDFANAKIYLLDGITNALAIRNFRMVSNFCQLARYHGIIDEKIRYKIIKAMDDFMQSENVPETQLNYYLIYIGKIKTLLHEGSTDTVTLNYLVKTNTCKKNKDGVSYVNSLVKDLNSEIAKLDNVEGFKVSIANYSPYEIVIEILGAVGSVASIASLVWQVITSVKNRKFKLEPVDTETTKKYVDARIDQMRSELLLVHDKYKGKKLNNFIYEVTQTLKTDLEELYSKDIMIYKIKNKKEK